MAFIIIRFLTTGGMLPKFGRENPFIIAMCYVGVTLIGKQLTTTIVPISRGFNLLPNLL